MVLDGVVSDHQYFGNLALGGSPHHVEAGFPFTDDLDAAPSQVALQARADQPVADRPRSTSYFLPDWVWWTMVADP